MNRHIVPEGLVSQSSVVVLMSGDGGRGGQECPAELVKASQGGGCGICAEDHQVEGRTVNRISRGRGAVAVRVQQGDLRLG